MRIPKQDQTNGWQQEIEVHRHEPLTENRVCDVLIVGGGYTGLSAALTFQKHYPDQSVIVIDALQPGQGASSRNSGYLVDSTLNDGHLSDDGLKAYQSKYKLNREALEYVAQQVVELGIDCDWNPCGKFHVGHGAAQRNKLERFSETLGSLGLQHKVMDGAELAKRLGTDYYTHGVWTAGAVMLQPAKLAQGLLAAVEVPIFGDTPVTSFRGDAKGITVETARATLQCKSMLVCTNGLIRDFGNKRLFPLYLTASLTRPISVEEWPDAPDEFGLLSAQAMGATVRWTSDRRLMIRNTCEVKRALGGNPQGYLPWHLGRLQARFPWVQPDMLESTWGGLTGISGNSANVFGTLEPGIYQAGCYNGGGIGLGCLFGRELAHLCMGQATDTQDRIAGRPSPNWLPPEPALSLGVRARLMMDRRKAVGES